MSIREIGASITMDSSQFQKDMKAVNSNLSGLKAEMNAVTAEFAENANSAEALSRKQQVLNDQESAAKAKVDLLTKAYQEQVKETGEASAAAGRLRKQLNNASADYAKAQQAAKSNREELQKHGPIYARVSDGAAKLGKKISEVTKEVIDGAKSMPVLGDTIKGVEVAATAAGKGLTLAGKGMEVTAKATGALITGAAAAATAMGVLAVSGASALTEMSLDAARRTQAAMQESADLLAKAEEAEAKRDKKTAKELREQAEQVAQSIDTRFSGLAENLTSLSSASQAAKDSLGTLLLPALESISGAGAELLEGFSKDLEAASGDTQAMAKVCSKYLKEAAKVIKTELPGLVSLGSDILQALLEGLGDAAPELLDAAGDIIQMLLDGLNEHAGDMGDGAAELVSQFLGFIVSNAPQLLTAGITLITNLINGISSDLPALIPVAADAVKQLLQALVENAPQLLVAGAKLILTLVEGLIDHIPDLIKAIPQLISDFISGFDDNLGELANIGSRIVDKILDGLKAAWHKLTDWIGPSIRRLDALGPEVGYASGYAGGLNYVPYDNYPALLHRGERVLTAAENASGAYGGGGNRTVNITVNTRELSRAQTNNLIHRADTELGKGV